MKEELNIFIKAIEQGYVYFKKEDEDRGIYEDEDKEIHKGYVVRYEEEIAYFKRSLTVAYGVRYFFNWRESLTIEDCDEELIRNPRSHELWHRCFNHELIRKEFLDSDNYGTVWALTKEELE